MRKWWVIALFIAFLVAVGAALLVSGSRTSAPAEGPGPTSTGRAQPTSSTQPDPVVPCAGTVRLVTTAGDSVPLTPEGSETLRIRVGETVHLESDGQCGDALTAAPWSARNLRAVDHRSATAVRAGSSRIEVMHAMCAGLSPQSQPCAGGVADDGRATVVVRAR